MRSGRGTGKEKVEMAKVRGKEEAKPVVAREVLPKGAVLSVEALIWPPSVFRTASTRINPIPLHPQARVDLYLSCAQ